MNDAQFTELAAWIAEAGLAGKSETALLRGFCERVAALGVPLARALVLVDTLHPIYEGRAFTWNAADGEVVLREYEPTIEGEALERWQSSPFYRMVQTGEPVLRLRIDAAAEAEFPVLKTLWDGMTDYVALVNRFTAQGVIGEMDCIYSSWATDRAKGFSDADIADFRRIVPLLALAIKSSSLNRIARTLVETYLGRDAGRRVLAGGIARGVAERIETVLWFSDLRGYTRITDTAAPEHIIPLLNDYADAVFSAIHGTGGDVLKLIGDGTLAIFTAADREAACRAALQAAAKARSSVVELNARRRAQDLPATEMYLALHFGEVFFGNIGSKERLDFTVVGPAVNEVSRIGALCRSVEQPLLLSASFAAAAGDERSRFVSIGRYALRGVRLPQELFTLDPTRRERAEGSAS